VNGAALTDGKIGQAYDFDGDDDYIEIPSSLSKDGTTFSFWYKSADAEDHAIFSIYDCSVTFHNILLLQNHHLTTGSTNFFENISLNDGNWHYIILYHAASNSSFYIDAIHKGSYDNTVDITNPVHTTFMVKNDECNNGLSHFGEGKIDEVSIWNRALTEDEIENLYNNGNGLQYFSKKND
jgi:hypothetical protein